MAFIFRYLEQVANVSVNRGIQLLSIAGLIILVYVAMFIQIIIHEAGHLVFGLISGYRFTSFRILSFMWLKEDGRLRFKRFNLAGTGGQCLMAPPDMKDGKIPVLLYNFGGSIMNIISAVIFFGVSFLFASRSIPRIAFLVLAVIGLAYAIMNGLPLKLGAVNNDGRNALDMMHNDEAMRAFWIQMKANEMTSEGVRLKDMPAEWFEVPSDESMKNGIIATVGVFACNRLMDEHRFEEADELMKRLLSMETGMAGLYRGLLKLDRMYIELIGDNQPGVVEYFRTNDTLRIAKQMKNYPSILRAQYAYALLRYGDRVAAEDALSRFETVAKKYPYPSDIEAERELIEIARKQAE